MNRPLLGRGVLAIWNGIEAGHEADFLRWHVGEHIPERLAVPGFLRARRYTAIEGTPAYFNFYEVETPGILTSPAYLDRLNAPSEQTRRIVPHFTDMTRTLCEVTTSHGRGVAGFMITLGFEAPPDDASDALDALLASPDISAAHLLYRAAEAQRTQESRMRGRPDGSFATILLAEGASAGALSHAVEASGLGAQAKLRGLYQLDFLMDRIAA